MIEPFLSICEVDCHSFRFMPFVVERLVVERLDGMLYDNNTRIVARQPAIMKTPPSTIENNEPMEGFSIHVLDFCPRLRGGFEMQVDLRKCSLKKVVKK